MGSDVEMPLLSYARKMRESYSLHEDIRREGVERRSRYMSVHEMGGGGGGSGAGGADVGCVKGIGDLPSSALLL